MKVATVRYTGRVRNQSSQGPSGKRYNFGGAGEASVETVGDALHFERRPNYEVDYTARGQLMNLVRGDVEDVGEAVSEIEYNVKRTLASELDLEIDSRKESVLEEALTKQAESLKSYMENQ